MRFSGTAVASREWGAYPILTFPDLPALETLLMPRPDQPPLGAGESASVPSAAAIANAIFDATGVRFREVPFTPERIRAGLVKAGVAEAGLAPAALPAARAAAAFVARRAGRAAGGCGRGGAGRAAVPRRDRPVRLRARAVFPGDDGARPGARRAGQLRHLPHRTRRHDFDVHHGNGTQAAVRD